MNEEAMMREGKLCLYVLAVLVLAWAAVACARLAPGDVAALAPSATPAPSVRGIHTPEDMQWQYDQWPEEYKLAVDPEGEVVVLFAYPDPLTDWVGRVFINHIPSFSSVALGYGGEITHEHYGSEEGRARLQAVLEDTALMARIGQRVDEIWGQASQAPASTATMAPVPTRLMALAYGELIVIGDCLRLSGDEATGGSRYLLWGPEYTVRVDGDTVHVDKDTGEAWVAHVGDKLCTSGGEVGRSTLDERTRQRITPGCPGPYWLVSSIRFDISEQQCGID
jgi:hypothetical protein